MIDMLQMLGFIPGETLFGFPYDWRQGPDVLAPLLGSYILTIFCRTGGKKLTLISHSFGGLICLCYQQLNAREYYSHVKRFIPLACPINGAGKPLEAILTGYNFDLPQTVAPTTTLHTVAVFLFQHFL